MKYLLIGLLKAYRLIVSPLYGNVCRYYPSCSAYALRAVSVHGAMKGSWLAARRLLSCHPWVAGGYEPVPGTPEHAEELRERAGAGHTCVHTGEHDPPAQIAPDPIPPGPIPPGPIPPGPIPPGQIPPGQIPPVLQRVT